MKGCLCVFVSQLIISVHPCHVSAALRGPLPFHLSVSMCGTDGANIKKRDQIKITQPA